MMRHRTMLAAAMIAGLAAAGGGGAEIIPRPPREPDPFPPRVRPWRKTKGPRSNAAKKVSGRNRKKAMAKIARASRRYNLRTGA